MCFVPSPSSSEVGNIFLYALHMLENENEGFYFANPPLAFWLMGLARIKITTDDYNTVHHRLRLQLHRAG